MRRANIYRENNEIEKATAHSDIIGNILLALWFFPSVNRF